MFTRNFLSGEQNRAVCKLRYKGEIQESWVEGKVPCEVPTCYEFLTQKRASNILGIERSQCGESTVGCAEDGGIGRTSHTWPWRPQRGCGVLSWGNRKPRKNSKQSRVRTTKKRGNTSRSIL